MGRTSLSQFGSYATPQNLVLAPDATAIILGQWWYDFSRISQAHVKLFLGIENRISVPGSFFPIYGIFLLADGDPVAANLFDVIPPDLSLNAGAIDNAFHGFNATSTIVNPGVKRQVLFAEQRGSNDTQEIDTTVQWRSIFFSAIGV